MATGGMTMSEAEDERVEELEEFEESEEEEEIEDRVTKLEGKTEGTKLACLRAVMRMEKRLKELEKRVDRMEEEFRGSEGTLNESINSLRDEMKAIRAEETPEGSTPKKRKLSVPTTLDEVTDEKLRAELQPYVTDAAPGGRLTAVQLAFLHLFFVRRGGQYSASQKCVDLLVKSGEDCGMWPPRYKPSGIKHEFRTYLKDKIKNIIKKKPQEDSCADFTSALAEKIIVP